jgi:hypothetical protein
MSASEFDRSSYLYHYTSSTALESILRQRLLRATDTSFLNDLKEIIYATEPLIPRSDELLDTVETYDAKHDLGQDSIVDSAIGAWLGLLVNHPIHTSGRVTMQTVRRDRVGAVPRAGPRGQILRSPNI